MMLDDVPNLAFAVGYTKASWTPKCDLTCHSRDLVALRFGRLQDGAMEFAA